MKTTKKIFAAVLAVMMIALMIPFSASAAESYSAKYKLAVDAADTDKVGDYTFSFFKIADLDLTTGKYSSTITDTALKNAVNGTYSDTKSQNILTACDTLYKNNKEAFGTAATTISFSSATTEATATVTDPGLYYVYCTSKPAKVTGVQSSLASLPYFDGTNYVSVDQTEHNLAEKVSTSSVTVDKSADKTYVGDNNKTVTYTLTASTAGSIDNQLKKYEIVDTMDEGLTFNENSVVVKYDGTGDALTLGTDYSIEKNHPYTGKNGEATATFAVVFKSATLASEKFYDAENVVVTYTADLNEKAKLNTAIRNTDAEAKTPLTVKVDDKNVNVVAETGDNGEAIFVLEGTTTTFKFDATQTYYAKEIAAPADYNLNSSVFKVNIDKSKEYTFVGNVTVDGNNAVANYPVTVPKTGGMGTMMFYVGGAALIACAGVLLFVLKRKKAAK